MKAKPVIALILIPLGIVTVWLWLVHSKSARRENDADSTGAKTSSANLPVVEASALIQQVAASLRQNSDPAQSGRLLADLRTRLSSMAQSNAVAAIRAALESGLDAPTGVDLKPSGDGRLATASSLRVFLLDQLRELDVEAAREFAKKILGTFTTPDEWAMALAVCATDTSAAGRDFVQRKAREMVSHEPWQQQPSAGFLEAFDVFVFTRDTVFAPELAAFVGQTNNRALAHAAFLTLDRLAFSDTATTLNALAAKPELLQGREATRAGYFARADVRDGEQRAVLERYLLNADLPASELDRFAGTFPNANFMVSQNLLTHSATPDAAWIASRDAASLRAVEQWLADPRFAHLKSSLAILRARLERIVPSAK